MISIWEKETFFAPQDVIVVGSGFVGLWSALLLKKKNPNKKISILERGFIPTGASTRNAGFACFGSLSELMKDAQEFGAEKMLQLAEMRYRGLKRIQKYFDEDEIDFELCGGYELYEPQKISKEELAHNIDYLNSLLRPITESKKTFQLADEKISEFGFSNTQHLVRNKPEGYQHSGKLLQALLHRVQGMGVQVFTGVEVKNISTGSDGVQIETEVVPLKNTELQKIIFSADQVLLCTNAFTKELLPDIDIVPARGQVMVTSSIPNLPFRGTFHSDEGFYYFRDLGDKVLLGGARNKAFDDEQTTDMNTSEFIQEQLQQYLDEVVLPNYKGRYTIEHRWAGIMAMGSEKMPIVKQLSDHMFCAVRMSGMGVALAPIVAGEVVRLMK